MEYYSKDNLSNVQQMEKNFEKINSKYPYPKYPFNYKERINRLKSAIELNQKFLNELIKLYNIPESYYKVIDKDELINSRFFEQKFMTNVFIYTMRDWAEERKQERD